MEDPRGRDCAGAGAGGGLRLFLSLGGNRRPFNQTAEIEKQTRTLIIQRRGGEEKGGEGRAVQTGVSQKKLGMALARSRGILHELPFMLFKVKSFPTAAAARARALAHRRIFEECGNLSRLPACLPAPIGAFR